VDVTAGVDMGGTKIQTAIVRAGKAIGQARLPTPQGGPAAVLKAVQETMAFLVRCLGASPGRRRPCWLAPSSAQRLLVHTLCTHPHIPTCGAFRGRLDPGRSVGPGSSAGANSDARRVIREHPNRGFETATAAQTRVASQTGGL